MPDEKENPGQPKYEEPLYGSSGETDQTDSEALRTEPTPEELADMSASGFFGRASEDPRYNNQEENDQSVGEKIDQGRQFGKMLNGAGGAAEGEVAAAEKAAWSFAKKYIIIGILIVFGILMVVFLILLLINILNPQKSCGAPGTGLISADELKKGPPKNKTGITHSDYQMPEAPYYEIRRTKPLAEQRESQYGRLEMIQAVYSVNKKWNNLHADQKILIGDLNAYTEVHATHNEGIDIDLFSDGAIFMDTSDQKDGSKVGEGYLNNKPDNPKYNKDLAIEYGKLIMDTGVVDFIYYGAENDKDDGGVREAINNYAKSKNLPGEVKFWEDHENHFHVRTIPGKAPTDVSSDVLTSNSAEYCETEAAGTTTICLDPGHPSNAAGGGKNTGAEAGGYKEVEEAYNISLELKKQLEKYGYNVVMTKDKVDKYVTNEDRAKICADASSAIMYRIHLDAAGSSKSPFHIIPTKGSQNTKNIYDVSKKYGNTIHKGLTEHLGITGKKTGAEPVDGGVCEEANCTAVGAANGDLAGTVAANKRSLPTVLIEAFSINNAAWLHNQQNMTKFAEGIALGIKTAIPPGSGGSGGILERGSLYTEGVKDSNDRNEAYLKDIMKYNKPPSTDRFFTTDCGRFVSTVYRSTVDPNFPAVSTGVIWSYITSHPEKYETFDVRSTKDLQPGDIIWKPGHIAIFAGDKGKNSNKWEASLTDHDPWNVSNWYPALSKGARWKGGATNVAR